MSPTEQLIEALRRWLEWRTRRDGWNADVNVDLATALLERLAAPPGEG
jgi:hypothetical protein